MKKPFNWVGFTWICIYLIVLFLFGWGLYQSITFPQSAIIKFFGSDKQGAIIVLSLFGGLFLIVGGILVNLSYKKSAIKTAFKACSELKAPVKVVSKALGAIHHTATYNARRKILISEVYFIVCEFQDGSRKNFQVKDVAVYNTILENDAGILTYKEYGQHTLFIDFQRTK